MSERGPHMDELHLLSLGRARRVLRDTRRPGWLQVAQRDAADTRRSDDSPDDPPPIAA